MTVIFFKTEKKISNELVTRVSDPETDPLGDDQ